MAGRHHRYEHFNESGASSARFQRPNEANVLVTSFGPYEASAERNASVAIASTLPSVLPTTPAHPTRVRIIHHLEPVGASYAKIDEFMHQLHDSRTRYDLILHIGVFPDSSEDAGYTLETTATRDSYEIRDNTQLLPTDQNQPIFWGTSPLKVMTTARIEDVFNRWASDVPANTKVRVSKDAGKFLSEYLYYSTLAHYAHTRNNDLPWHERTAVALMQAPPATDSEAIERGRVAVTSLIYSLVDSRRMRDGDHDDDPAEGMITIDGHV